MVPDHFQDQIFKNPFNLINHFSIHRIRMAIVEVPSPSGQDVENQLNRVEFWGTKQEVEDKDAQGTVIDNGIPQKILPLALCSV